VGTDIESGSNAGEIVQRYADVTTFELVDERSSHSRRFGKIILGHAARSSKLAKIE